MVDHGTSWGCIADPRWKNTDYGTDATDYQAVPAFVFISTAGTPSLACTYRHVSSRAWYRRLVKRPTPPRVIPVKYYRSPPRVQYMLDPHQHCLYN